jgi:Alpha/beta hydrolase of unknown function (DUF900)
MKIAFTSCMDAERVPDQPVWARIQALEPDALMLLGDQIYMDWGLASLKRVPPWRKRWDKHPDADTAAAFAEEMHRRYRLQWAVPGFKALVTDLVERRGASRLYLCRDEHDYAWNNAVGIGTADDPRWVPDPLKAASDRLFAQFRAVLANPQDWQGGYPAVDQTLPTAPQPAAVLGPLRVLLLEQRASRSSRYLLDMDDEPAPARRLLSDADEAALHAALALDAGPLLLAGPSPLKHDYRFSNQGWWAKEDASYPEYARLLEGARTHNRAVLYLGGDIHRLAYGGPVEAGSTVVQMLASGAAVGRVLLKTFEPSFAWLHVEGEAGQAGRVSLHGQRGGQVLAPVELHFDAAGRWTSLLPAGECTAGALELPVDGAQQAQHPLSVLTVRRRARRGLAAETDPVVPGEQLDDVYLDALPSDMPSHPQALHLEPVAAGASMRLRLLPASAEGIRAAFERAVADQRAAVVFFIHGFQKSFSQSIDQACRLRERFNIEPVLFSWPSGEEGGLLKALGSFAEVNQTTQRITTPLSTALFEFGLAATAFAEVMPATVLARSMGARALAAVLEDEALAGRAAECLPDIRRLLLSAPAAAMKDHRQWLGRWPGECVVTLNAQDRTLRAADWLESGPLLGQHLPVQDRAAGVIYLDWSDLLAVGPSHDYLLPSQGADVDELNVRLVTGRPFGEAELQKAGVRRA